MRLSLVIAASTLSPSTAVSADASTTGTCSPLVLSNGGVTSIDIKCSTSVVTNFSYTLEGSAGSIIARHYDITEVALSNFFKQVNNENVPPYLVTQRLDTLVKEIKRLRSELQVVSITNQVRALWTKALTALDEGRVDDAISLHKQILEDSKPALDRAFNTIRDAARIKRSLGELYILTYDYPKAIEQFSTAIEILPSNSKMERGRVFTLWAETIESVSTDPEMALKLAREAVSDTEEYLEQAPEWHLRALSTLMKAMLFNRDSVAAINVFQTKISPLLDRDDLKGSIWSILCFACAGDALIDLRDFRGAVDVLMRGLDYGEKQVLPDKVMLAKIYSNLAVAIKKIRPDKRGYEIAFGGLLQARSLLLEAFPDENHPDFAWLYYNVAGYTVDQGRRVDHYLHAFEIMNRIMPYDNGGYIDLLRAIIKPDDVPMPGLPSITVHLFEPDDKYFTDIHDVYMKNVRRIVADDLERVASASNLFASILFEEQRFKQTLLICRRTADLYEGKSYGRNLGIALVMCARVADEKTGGDDLNVVSDYKRHLT
jgi:tetratricopeptide (TPR) repeat protein